MRLTAEEFIDKIKKAPTFALWETALDGELHLLVRDGDNAETFLAPLRNKMSHLEANVFANKLDAVINLPLRQVHRLF